MAGTKGLTGEKSAKPLAGFTLLQRWEDGKAGGGEDRVSEVTQNRSFIRNHGRVAHTPTLTFLRRVAIIPTTLL